MQDEQYLETFPSWLTSFASDVRALGELANHKDTAAGARRSLVGGLNYVFKSLDLIPDGIDDLGYLDDAFVIRVAARHALAIDEALAKHSIATRLSSEVAMIEAFLQTDFSRMDAYVESLRDGAARGRTVSQIIEDDAILSSFISELNGWAASYQVPAFTKHPRTIVKLRAFLSAKLP
jgi:uncharacterized membrane protein YkvA (DUF1232 family)